MWITLSNPIKLLLLNTGKLGKQTDSQPALKEETSQSYNQQNIIKFNNAELSNTILLLAWQ